MRVFVTGATGFIGSAVTTELLAAGHQVLGLARSREKAETLTDAGAEVLFGSLEDANILRDGVAKSDGVIHLAFNHDFSKFVANCEDDRRVIEVLGAAIAGSQRPLLITSGTGMVSDFPDRPCTEEDPPVSSAAVPRAASEEAAASMASKGINVSVVRLPQVHDTTKQGLITYQIAVAREKKVSAYVGDGNNRWPAAHVSDTARLYRLALEKAQSGARYHSVGEEGVPLRQIAEIIGRRLKMPTVSLDSKDAPAHFGWLAHFIGRDVPASSALTQKRLGWHPTGPRLIPDLEQMSDADYSQM
jgi:nucleoside-diphosphate-sugar epimerase